MRTVGIICEYNPFHLGHSRHIEKTKEALSGDACIVCVMSGNYVQRGDFAIFGKHARAKMAVLGGADVVIELPAPFALGSAREFAKAGVHLLDALGLCDYLSFGSECGELGGLQSAARAIVSDEAEAHIREGLGKGLPYARAQQAAADTVLGELSCVFKSPNNTLGIEYIKAIDEKCSPMRPMTVLRTGGDHDGDTGFSASALREVLASGVAVPDAAVGGIASGASFGIAPNTAPGSAPFENMPETSVAVIMEELAAGRGPVLMKNMEQAVLSRLRAVDDFAEIPGASDGLGRRFSRIALIAPTVSNVLEGVKTKRFAMSRIRRVMMCAVLGIRNDDVKEPPPYIRVLAMNKRGREVLRKAAKRASLPIIIKPASVSEHGERAVRLFELESGATDFYALAYKNPEDRVGGGEWRRSPVVVLPIDGTADHIDECKSSTYNWDTWSFV